MPLPPPAPQVGGQDGEERAAGVPELSASSQKVPRSCSACSSTTPAMTQKSPGSPRRRMAAGEREAGQPRRLGRRSPLHERLPGVAHGQHPGAGPVAGISGTCARRPERGSARACSPAIRSRASRPCRSSAARRVQARGGPPRERGRLALAGRRRSGCGRASRRHRRERRRVGERVVIRLPAGAPIAAGPSSSVSSRPELEQHGGRSSRRRRLRRGRGAGSVAAPSGAPRSAAVRPPPAARSTAHWSPRLGALQQVRGDLLGAARRRSRSSRAARSWRSSRSPGGQVLVDRVAHQRVHEPSGYSSRTISARASAATRRGGLGLVERGQRGHRGQARRRRRAPRPPGRRRCASAGSRRSRMSTMLDTARDPIARRPCRRARRRAAPRRPPAPRSSCAQQQRVAATWSGGRRRRTAASAGAEPLAAPGRRRPSALERRRAAPARSPGRARSSASSAVVVVLLAGAQRRHDEHRQPVEPAHQVGQEAQRGRCRTTAGRPRRAAAAASRRGSRSASRGRAAPRTSRRRARRAPAPGRRPRGRRGAAPPSSCSRARRVGEQRPRTAAAPRRSRTPSPAGCPAR